MRNNKGFTLVELLAVIVILAIIMIIAIPSVLGTMTVASRKTFLEYYQKVYMTGNQLFMEKKNFGSLNMTSQEVAFIFDIRTDLGMSSTGDYKGFYLVYRCVNKTACPESEYTAVLLYNDDYFVFKSFLERDGLPEEKDIMSISELMEQYNIKDLDSITKQTYADMMSKRICNTLKEDIVDGATGEVIGSAPGHPDAWVGKTCEEPVPIF